MIKLTRTVERRHVRRPSPKIIYSMGGVFRRSHGNIFDNPIQPVGGARVSRTSPH